MRKETAVAVWNNARSVRPMFNHQLFRGLLKRISHRKTANLGGIILIAIGVYNLFSKEKTQIETKSILKQSLLLGFGVGLDGAFGNLSLALMGYNSFFVPVTIALTHLLLIGIGIFLSERHFLKIFKKLDFIPSLILILLGLYKLIFFFF